MDVAATKDGPDRSMSASPKKLTAAVVQVLRLLPRAVAAEPQIATAVPASAIVQGRELSQAHANRRRHSIAAMLRHVDRELLLSALNYETVAQVVAAFKDRESNGYAPDTVTNCVWDLRAFLKWLEEAGLWQSEFEVDRLCSARKHRLFSLEESRALAYGKPVYTPAELSKLYKCATRIETRHRHIQCAHSIGPAIRLDIYCGEDVCR